MTQFLNPYVESLRSFYNGISQYYDRSHVGGWHDKAAVALVDAAGANIKEGSWVLDLATGTGKVALSAASKVGSTGRILGIDISEKFLAHAKQNASELGVQSFVEFLNQDVTDLALPATYSGQCFDAILCGSALALFPDPLELLRRASREFLKQDGVFVADMHGNIPGTLFINIAAEYGVKTRMDPIWANDPEIALRQLFESASYDVESVATIPSLGKVKWDASTPEAVENLWNTLIVKAPWLSIEGIDQKKLAELKQTWLQGLVAQKGHDGFIVDNMTQIVVVTKNSKRPS